jgi:WhiB family redox-sensing transcriptional regulator
MSTTCPRCGGTWTIVLNPGTVHYAWHDDELCCRCRGRLEVEVAAELAELAAAAAAEAARARDALDAELAAALDEQDPAPRPIREGIPWSPEERVRHINVALELSAPSVPQGDWIADALCAQVDGELFFPEKGGDVRAAKAVCGNCPVTAPCLDWALTTGQRNGVYGGLSDRERLALRREQAS